MPYMHGRPGFRVYRLKRRFAKGADILSSLHRYVNSQGSLEDKLPAIGYRQA